MTTTRTATPTAEPLFTGRCRRGHTVQGTAYAFVGGGLIACPCGAVAAVRAMTIIVKPDHRCGARCTSATGPNCECSCAGQRHGLDLRA